MLRGNMNLSRLMVYGQSIEEAKLSRISRNLNRGGQSDKNLPRFKKSSQTQDEPRDPKFKLEKGSVSQDGKPTCATCRKKHYGKCRVGTRNCIGYDKYEQKVRDCPNIPTRGKEGKKDPPSISEGGFPKGRLVSMHSGKEDQSRMIKMMFVTYSFSL
ncbi:uncharacterized protein LOC107013358 [Solanum pennellii]|uniref:Uncharacterized protein LOC107013358 n=1 Tax=Solanum pennellii TaxID=28526 RepID=A0ABM1GBP6_SOLPN|nr:uncharacterized protein LOC107013358 [Solanum pennellii]